MVFVQDTEIHDTNTKVVDKELMPWYDISCGRRGFSAFLFLTYDLDDQSAVPFCLLRQVAKYRAIDRIRGSQLRGSQPVQCVVVAFS